MRTARSLPYGGVSVHGGICSGRVSIQGWGSVSRGGSRLGGLCPREVSVQGGSIRETPPVDRQTPAKILPLPKLRLRAIIKMACIELCGGVHTAPRHWVLRHFIDLCLVSGLGFC